MCDKIKEDFGFRGPPPNTNTHESAGGEASEAINIAE